MTERFLPYGKQWVSEEDIQAVKDVLEGDWLTTGPAVSRFEDALKQLTGANAAIAVNSGTAALHCAYFAAGLTAGDEVITSPLTFAATSNAALYLGAIPRFVDVEPDTGCLDPGAIAAAITPKTRLVTAVDYAGHPADYDRLRNITDQHGLTLVSDSAHSLGGSYKGAQVGTLSDISAVSFHPVKPITTGEGGAVLTHNDEWAVRSAQFRTHGITSNPSLLEHNPGPWHQEMQLLGFNYRLSDIHAALGTSQLKRLPAFIERRQWIAEQYCESLGDLPQITLPTMRTGCTSGWHLYVIRVAGNPTLRKPLFTRLRELGIGVQLHYIPVHHHPFYRDLGYKPDACPNACDYSARALSLPIYPKMTDDDVSFCIERVRQAVREVL